MIRRFHFPALAIAAAIAADNDMRMEGTAVEKQAKLDAFAADFTKRLDAPAAPAKPAGEQGTEIDAHQAIDEEARDAEAAAAGGTAEVDEDEVETDPGAGDPGEEVEEIEEEPIDEEEEEEELDEDFRRAAGRANLPITLEDIPEEARPLVKKRLKEVEAGFTRAMMDARSYRAEERFRKEHPVDFIAEMLAADPELEAKVSAELEKRGDETYAESREIITKDKRKKAQEAIDNDRTSEAARETRITEVESLAQKACARFGIPFGRAVEAAIANAIITSENADIANGDITDIVKSIAKELGAVSRKERIEEGKERVLGKVRDRNAGPKIQPGKGRGAPPAAGGKGKKTSLADNLAATVARMYPGAD